MTLPANEHYATTTLYRQKPFCSFWFFYNIKVKMTQCIKTRNTPKVNLVVRKPWGIKTTYVKNGKKSEKTLEN